MLFKQKRGSHAVPLQGTGIPTIETGKSTLIKHRHCTVASIVKKLPVFVTRLSANAIYNAALPLLCFLFYHANIRVLKE